MITGPARPWARVALVGALLAALFALRFAVDQPAYLGVGLFLVLPVVLASAWFGLTGAALGTLLAGAGFVISEAIRPTNDLTAANLIPATAVRLLAYGAIGVAVARLVAAQVARGRELDALRAAREALVPAELVQRPGLRLAAHYAAAQETVGGDFYLAAAGPRGSTVLVVGDVVGKGLAAARRAAFVRTALATFAPFEDDPARLLELANAALIERAGTSVDYVTAACVVHRPGDRFLSWALAGHPPPVRLDDGEPLSEAGAAPPLGIERELGVRAGQGRLRSGEGVLLYTDGILDARGGGHGVFGEERLAAVVREHAGDDPARVVAALRDALAAWARIGDDDVCLLAARALDDGFAPSRVPRN